METIVRQKCDNLTGNYVIMSKGNRLEHNELVLAGAGLFQASGITPNPDKLKECKKIIKKREGVFSTFRGLGEYIVRTKMAISDSPEQYLTHLETVYQLLKKFSSDSRTLLAAMVIVDQSQPADYAHMAEKTKYIYQQMRTAHPLLTDQGDMPFAALMAVLGRDTESIHQQAEEIYGILKKDLRAANNTRQALSHLLAIYDGSPDEKCAKVCEVAKGLRKTRHSLGSDLYLAILGVVVNSPLSADELIRQIGEADDYLRQFKPFKGVFGMGKKATRSYAVQVVESAYARQDFSMDALSGVGVTAMINASIETTILMLMLLYCMMASSAAASSAAAAASSSS